MKIFWVVLYLFYGCGMQQPSKQSFDVTDLLTAFPPCFSMQAGLHFMDPCHSFRCRITCCVRYNQQIDFIVKGPLGMGIFHGRIDKKGVTVVDRLRRVVHHWDYKRIRQQHHFSCNYLLIQSLLLGMRPIPDALPSNLAYTYDDFMRKVIAVRFIDTQKGNYLLYRYKMATDRTCLSGIKIHFSLRDKGKLHQGGITLYKLHFKELKKPNIKLTIPAYYRKA